MEQTERNESVPKLYSRAEEIVHALTHGTGAALSIAGLVYLIVYVASAGPLRITAVTSYGASLFVAYTSSTLYHAWPSTSVKQFFRKVDHAAIFILIAGTYTPFTLLVLDPAWGWPLFGVVWTVAAVGTALKFADVEMASWVDVTVYLSMGWLAVVAFYPLSLSLSTSAFAFVIAGGLSYTVGTLFFLWEEMPFNHAVWHLFVLGGSAFHFAAVVDAVGT